MNSRYILLLISCFLVLSCSTYTIPVENFKEQLVGVDSKSLTKKSVSIVSPLFVKKYYTNNLKSITVWDKKYKQIKLQNQPSIEMRVTTIDNKRYYMYFDSVYLENDTLYGNKARLIGLKYTEIPFDKIIKIEIQDGRKKYSSVN
jgi:hypothetical protein